MDYAKKNISKVETGDPNAILDLINRLPDIQYNDMADVVVTNAILLSLLYYTAN